MGINRSDYLIDVDPDGSQHIKQVEINTIAPAGAHMACCTTAYHR